MPQYSYATYADALSALASRLYDPSFQQWTQAELLGYLYESLRTWNALSCFWRAEMVFTPQQNVWWYDLRTQPATIIPYTMTQQEIIQQVENHLLEPPTPDKWSGSSQFSLGDLTQALQRRQDDTLGTTACTITRSTPDAPINTRVPLGDNIIDIRRVAWLPTPGFGYSNKILRQSDMWASRAFDSHYMVDAPEPPSTWMQNTEPPPSFDADRVPPVTGVYDVLSVNSGENWIPGTDGPLSVPDDWSWVMKWGALMDLLSRESNSKDELRAQYCKARYQEGLALLESMPTALAFRMNNVPVALDAVKNGDDFNPAWQSQAGGYPMSAYAFGNLIALGPMPNSSTAYSATVSVVRNAPVVGPYIQVARDCFDAIIDYAQHLAMFKAGGTEFVATIALYKNFQKKASQYNGKLKEMGFFEMPQLELSVAQEQQNRRYLPGTGPSD